MKKWLLCLLALLLMAGSLGPALQAEAFSGGESPSAEQVLERTELIVIARAGEVIGSVDLPGGAIYSLYLLHVESYIQPAAPGPDTLVVATIGGRTIYRAMNGPQLGPERGLFFLRRNGDYYAPAVGRLTPHMHLEGNGFKPPAWVDLQRGFRPLLDQPRYPAYPRPAVRLNGRQIGGAWLLDGRSYLPAAQLAAALGAEVAAQPDGGVELRRGEEQVLVRPIPLAGDGVDLVPLRAVADGLGLSIRWDAAGWAVEMEAESLPPAPAYLSEAEAVARQAEIVDGIIAEGKGSGSFADHYQVVGARLNTGWIDPATGAERPVWELDIAFAGRSERFVLSFFDAVTGELIQYVWA